MAQSTDLVVPNTSAAGVRSAINTRLLAIATHQSGATAPATTYAYQFWADTTAGLLKQRDGANTSWITIGTLGTANLGLAALASPTFTGTPAAPTATAGTNTTQLATTAFVATAVANASPVLETAKTFNWNSLTTNTSLDFTSVPSWVKRITVMLNGISTNGATDYFLRIGSGSFVNTGYSGYASFHNFNSPTNSSRLLFSTGFSIYAGNSANLNSGVLQLVLLTGNTWIVSGQLGATDYPFSYFGSLALSGVLDRVQLVTNGTEVFDAGNINILYE